MSISELEEQLALAEERVRQLLRSPTKGLAEALAAFESVAAAQRELAAAKGEPYVVPYDLGFRPDAAVSEPVVLQTDDRTFLTFSAVTLMPDGKYHGAGYGIVEVELCTQSKFGYPNDEALPGHPLYKKGLGAYGVYEVRNSSWVRLMTEQNRVSFPNTPESTQMHFIFSFHDSTFECTARGLRATLSTEPYAKIFEQLTKKAFGWDRDA